MKQASLPFVKGQGCLLWLWAFTDETGMIVPLSLTLLVFDAGFQVDEPFASFQVCLAWGAGVLR